MWVDIDKSAMQAVHARHVYARVMQAQPGNRGAAPLIGEH